MQKVCGSLDLYFTTVHTIINSTWSTNSLLCDNPRNKSPRIGLHQTLPTCWPWSFSGREMNKHDSGVALISLISFGYDGSRTAQYLLPPHLVFHLVVGVTLAFSCFFNQIPHQKKSEILVGMLSPM